MTKEENIINAHLDKDEYIKDLEKEIKELHKKIKFNEKSRRKMQKSLMKIIQQKEEIINKARKYVKENSIYFAIKDKIGNYFANCNCDELLEILDNKGE